MKKISWIVPECFIDVDVPVISKLQQYYKIRLILVLPCDGIDNVRYVNSFLAGANNVEIHYLYKKYRGRSFRNVSFYNKIITDAKDFNPDIYYLSFMGRPYALPLYALRLPRKKCIVPCHNVTTPKGASKEKIAEIYKNWWLRTFKNIQVFSKSQLDVLNSNFPGKNVFMSYLMIKDYGVPTINNARHNDIIKFLFFGNIVRYKRLDLLLAAVNILAERGLKGFKVIVAGHCRDWEEYSKMIKYPELIDCRIERIPNEEIPNIFASCQYMVLPYQDIAQSGAITVGFRYNLPTIVSNIEQFKEFVVDGETSLSFESQNASSLADIMQYAIENHKVLYPTLCEKQRIFIAEHFSDEAIIKEYIKFFNKI